MSVLSVATLCESDIAERFLSKITCDFQKTLYLCHQKVETENIMCVVDVKVDEAVLREVLPELDSTMAIRLWAQKLIDMHVKSLLEEAKATTERDLIQDDVCRTVWEEVEEEYKDMVSEDDDETIDLETFRAELHKMVDDVYAEP